MQALFGLREGVRYQRLKPILSHYQLALRDAKPVKPQRHGFTVSRTGGLQMVVQGVRYGSFGTGFANAVSACWYS